MTDNRQEQSGSSIVLTHAHLDSAPHAKYFPNANPCSFDNLYSGSLNNEVFAWVLFEDIGAGSVCIHLYVLPEFRVPSVFKRIKLDVPGLFQEFMEETGVQKIVAVCNYNNKASMKFQKLLGFEPQAYWMGAQYRR